jgi:hypothetical protein
LIEDWGLIWDWRLGIGDFIRGLEGVYRGGYRRPSDSGIAGIGVNQVNLQFPNANLQSPLVNRHSNPQSAINESAN